jgi:UDP-glucose 4-epimerase
MRILITGVTGRIGANLAAALVKQGHDVRGFVWPGDPRVEKLASLSLDLRTGSLTNAADLTNAMRGVQAVYHLGAAFQGGGPFSDDDYFETNVRGAYNSLQAARELEDLRAFVFAGTDALYDKYPPGGVADPIREDDAVRRPRGWYALSKSMGEDMCVSYHGSYGMPTVVLRFSMVVGAGEILDWPQFRLSSLKSRPELAPLWDGEERLVILRDENGRAHKKHIADVRDIVHGCVRALDAPNAAGEVIQLGGPSAFTWDDAVPHLSDRTGIPVVDARVSGGVTYYEYDLSKARRLLGFEPEVDIRRMIDDAVAFRAGEDIGVLPTI